MKRITTKSGNVYRIRLRISDGSQICETYQNKKMADARELEIKNGIASKTFVSRNKIPLFSAAVAEFLTAKKNTLIPKTGKKRKQSTIDTYESAFNETLIRAFGKHRVDEISTPMINVESAIWAESMYGTTIGQRLSLLSAVFKRQIAFGVIVRNPVIGADRPAGLRDDDDEEGVTPDKIHTEEHVQALIQYAPTERDSLAFRLFSESGIRHGEFLGLTEPNCAPREIRITQQFTELYDVDTDEPIFTAPKTKTSTRVIPISAELGSLLTKWKLKNPISPYGLMFSTKDGSPLSRKATWTAYRSAIKRANEHLTDPIPEKTIHSLRHRFASLLLTRNPPVPPAEVATLMGHTSPLITQKVYSHFVRKEAKFDPESMFGAQATIL